MKTKPFTLPTSSAPVAASYAVDMPCYISVPGGEPLGPYPLALCLLRGLEFAKTASPFTIASEDGPVLLILENLRVHGEPIVVDVFLQQLELAKLFFQ